MDMVTDEICRQVYYMVRRYGRENDKDKYKVYYDRALLVLRNKSNEKKRKAEEEVEILRQKLEEAEEKIAKQDVKLQNISVESNGHPYSP